MLALLTYISEGQAVKNNAEGIPFELAHEN